MLDEFVKSAFVKRVIAPRANLYGNIVVPEAPVYIANEFIVASKESAKMLVETFALDVNGSAVIDNTPVDDPLLLRTIQMLKDTFLPVFV